MLTLLLTALLNTFPASADLNADQLPATGAYVNEDGGPLIPLLTNAREKIDIEIYTMKDLKVRALLRAALKRGVKVRIVKEPKPFGDKCDVFGSSVAGGAMDNAATDCADQQKLVADVRAAGGSYVPFDKSVFCPNGGGGGGNGCFEHGKIALVDGLALMSTGNFDGTNLCIASENPRSCDRDYSLIISDRLIVDTLEKIFDADLAGARYDVASVIPQSLAQTLTVSPISLKPLVDYIDSARTSIDLSTQYLKDPTLNEALTRAAKRGVKISITVASPCSFGRPTQAEAQEVQNVYSAFDAAGISSRMFTAQSLVNGHAGYMHAKVIVVDGARAWVGSVNGSTESLTQNREYGLIFDQANDVQTVLASVRADHDSKGDESWQDSLGCKNDKAGGTTAPVTDPVTPIKKTPVRKKKF